MLDRVIEQIAKSELDRQEEELRRLEAENMLLREAFLALAQRIAEIVRERRA